MSVLLKCTADLDVGDTDVFKCHRVTSEVLYLITL